MLLGHHVVCFLCFFVFAKFFAHPVKTCSVRVQFFLFFGFVSSLFLVACTRLYTPLCPSVGRSVCRFVTLYFFYGFFFGASLLLPKWSSDLKYGPFYPHATSVAVYPALFLSKFVFRCSIHFLLELMTEVK